MNHNNENVTIERNAKVDYSKTVVKYDVSYTRNMGDYNSLRINVGVEDGPRGDETVDSAFNRVVDFVESKLFIKVDEVEADLKARR